jgi:peptide/nickel transport system ATP-binding protein
MDIKNLTKVYSSGFQWQKKTPAVNDVNFTIKRGRFISLIGESGSGKTTVGKLILHLLKPTTGSITFNDRNIRKYGKKELHDYYRQVQGIFQDPFSSFNPLYKVDRVFSMILENFLHHENPGWDKVEAIVSRVGMNPQEVLGKYPHQLSGGQLQRLLIARVLLMDVKILVADEIISMLDASTRIDILNLLGNLAYEEGMSVLFITHDLSLGYYISEETIIMYKGRIVEMGASVKIFKEPIHPYTRMLLASVPDIAVKWDKRTNFLPECIETEVREFYAKNKNKNPGLIAVDDEHKVIMTL